MHSALLLPCALLLASLGAPPAPPAGLSTPSTTGSATRRLLRAAAEREHADLLRGLDLWVDHSTWPNAWNVTTGDYEVRTVESFALARSAGTWLETMRGHFRALLGGPERAPGPVLVHVLPALQDYRDLGNTHGAEHSSFYGSFFAINAPESPVATYYANNDTLLGMWLTHSALHEYLVSSLGSQPNAAVSEGLASYFALYYWAWAFGVDELERIENQELYIPLERLLRANLSDFTADTEVRTTELGMFFAYLLHFREDTRIQVDEDGAFGGPAVEYLRRAARGQSVANTELHALLSRDLDALEEDFRAFRFPK